MTVPIALCLAQQGEPALRAARSSVAGQQAARDIAGGLLRSGIY
ncbi:hypothetical protein QF032_007904 [Streptomyces achromogenes]|nr:hypothetical protein [Streptomyces achromogenes]MDQ0836060.1 hypothetical protein [Streptomyces achromogenes]